MAMKRFFSLFLLTCGILCVPTFAQNAAQPEPYKAGENLEYEAKFSKIIKGISVAELNFNVEQIADNRDFLITSEARSKGTLAKLFNFKFNLNIKSTVDDKNYAVKRTVKRDEQGDRLRESEALFDYAERKVIFIETDPKDAMRSPRRIASPITGDTQDFISAIYTLRRMPLTVGKSFDIKVSDSGLVYKIPVRVTARELQKSILGKVWCFRIEPEVFGANRLIDQKGSMILWITDDARRLPVRSQINADIGRVEVKLKRINEKSSEKSNESAKK